MTLQPEPLVVTFVRFLAIAVLVTYGASRFRIPYTIAMVIVGLGVSLLRIDLGVGPLELESDVILLVFLPGLLFEASYHVDFTVFRTHLWPISIMALVGVAISTAIIGAILYLVLGLPLTESLLFGIIISATDPVAVIALFKQLGVGRQLSILVEGESLFNDGIVIVGFSILVGLASGMPDFSVAGTLLDMTVAIVGGVALGLIAGFLFAEMMRRTDDPLIDIALTTILAYGTYLLAEDPLQGRVSPIIAVVVAGIVVGNYSIRERERLSARSTMLIASFWEFIVFLINSAVFLLIGLEVAPDVLIDDLLDIVVAIAAVLLARIVIVYGLRPILNLRAPQLPIAWSHVMFWGALRGAVSVALVLSIPYAVQSRERLIVMVFGVVFFSMIVQGLTMSPLLRKLGLTDRGQRWREFQEAIGKMAAAEASIDAVVTMEQEHVISQSLARRLKERFEGDVSEYSQQVSDLVAEEPGLADANVNLVRHELAHNQKQALLQLLRRGIINDEVYSEMVSRIDEHLERPEEDGWELAVGLSHDLPELVSEGAEGYEPDEGGEEASRGDIWLEESPTGSIDKDTPKDDSTS